MSGLQEYFQLLLGALSQIYSEDKPLIHAVICKLVSGTGRLIASRKSSLAFEGTR